MRFLRHLSRLLLDTFAFAWETKAWWMFPIVVLLLLIAVLVIAGQSVTPFIYTLF